MNVKGILPALALIFLLAGCSGGDEIPSAPESDPELPRSTQGPSEHVLWGVWGFEFDKTSGEIIAVPKRGLAVHYDITQMVISPACQFCFAMTVLEFKPVEKYVKIRIGLWNKTKFTGYDVRGIVVSNAEGLSLRNPDGYTDVWDDGGSIEINPFLAYAKEQPQREFGQEVMSVREYELDFDSVGDLSSTTLVVDASYPGNCREPYDISVNYQTSLPAEGGFSTQNIEVSDWQVNSGPVYLDATPIGGGVITMNPSGGTGSTWHATIDAPQYNQPGKYKLWVKAQSENAKWSHFEQIEVNVNESVCVQDVSNTWETAWKVVPNDQRIQYVCPADPEDWYSFDIERNLGGVISIGIIAGNGSLRFEFYSDPEAEPLVSAEAYPGPPGMPGEEVFIELPPLALGAGTYNVRISYSGEHPGFARFFYGNYIQDIPCISDGNDSYLTAYELTASPGSGEQFVCADDPEDWYMFDLEAGPYRPLEIDTDPWEANVEITLYQEGQAQDPDGPNIVSVSVDKSESLDLNGLGLIGGKYYVRVKALNPQADDQWKYTIRFGWDVLQWARDEWYANYTKAIHIGSDDTVYIVGGFIPEIDLDIGPGEEIVPTLGASDSYLISADSDGSYNWGLTWGGSEFDMCWDVTTDVNGNIYLAGMFQGTVDLDPGPGVDLYTAEDYGTYLMKLNVAGELLWIIAFGLEDEDSGCGAYSITLNEAGGVYLSGFNYGQTDFDPGEGVELHNSLNRDAFLSKYDTDGNYKWTRTWSGDALAWGFEININSIGEIYVAGIYSGEGDFDPGPGIELQPEYGSYDNFLTKFDATGTYHWTRSWGGIIGDEVEAVEIDSNGNPHVLGKFRQTVDFDPGPGVDEYTVGDLDQADSYINRFDSSGNYLGAIVWGSSNGVFATGMVMDSAGKMYICGKFSGWCDFDPGPKVEGYTGTSVTDGFLLRLTPDGGFDGVLTWAGNGDVSSIDVDVDSYDDVYVVGIADAGADLDPGPGIFEVSESGSFLSKFSF